MNILLFTSKFDLSGDNRWLMEDLVDEFISLGHMVTVALTDIYSDQYKGELKTGSDLLRVIKFSHSLHSTGRIAKVRAHLSTAISIHREFDNYVGNEKFEICIFTSVGVMSFYKPRFMRSSGRVEKLVFILWDFFPANHIDIGRIKKRFWTKIAKKFEFLSFKNSDLIYTMTPKGSEFLSRYHPKVQGKVLTQPPWSEVEIDHINILNSGRSKSEFVVVWGGQMIPGRGIKTLIDALVIVQRGGMSMTVKLVGDGPKFEEFKGYVDSSQLYGVQMLGRLDRVSYRNLLISADVGIATTIPNVSVPTFSAKISEYCAYGVPCIVSIETSSDAGQIIAQAGAGIACDAGDAEGLARALVQMYTAKFDGNWEQYSYRARKFFEENLASGVVAGKILND
jgi:glycosyltransferase involved in cell wall biosynthesis